MANGIDAAGRQQHFDAEHNQPGGIGLSLLFRRGERPTVGAIAQLVDAARETGLLARVSHRPEDAAGWLELLASGLTFDLRGLTPAHAGEDIEVEQAFGFEGDYAIAGCETVDLVPSGHIVAGAGLEPVLRVMTGLAANLALHLPVRGVYWRSAHTLMEPRYFSRLMLNWLGGGAFPALGLTALVLGADGSVASRGLAHFTGQEMQLEGRAGETPADTIKLAVRVIDHLVRHGRISEPSRIGTGPDALVAEPSRVGRLVLVWRGD